MSRPIRRVCIVRFGGMGDILLSTPAVRAIAEHFDACEIDYVVGRGNKDALTGIPYIRNVIEWGPRGTDAKLGPFLAFLGRLRAAHYDLFINFQPSAKTVAMSLASGAPRILTFQKDMRKSGDGKVRHAIDDFIKELKPLGITEVTNRRMDFCVPEAAHQKVRELLAVEGISEGNLLIAVNPGGTRLINRWPPEYFIGLLDRIADTMPQARLIVTGGPDDVKRAQTIAEGVKPTTRMLNLARKLSVKETGALLTRVAVFVTPDTGPLHIASALGIPMVALSGAADPDRTGPKNIGDLVVIKRDLPCVPCRDRSCSRGDIACMNQMPVDWVFEAVQQRLAAQGILPPYPPTSGFGIERVTPSGLIPLPIFRTPGDNLK